MTLLFLHYCRKFYGEAQVGVCLMHSGAKVLDSRTESQAIRAPFLDVIRKRLALALDALDGFQGDMLADVDQTLRSQELETLLQMVFGGADPP